ncbi:polysaccharide deacetylase family protein [Actinoplanes sp. ATCC 53533]|uniref:polysaccharide deacetylase family protein n=1 Tax=Actinoplanes sp. ATCC 53533 TaxID=1288362 RepID=UPI001F2C07CF|nr:polysaccharide deacetylase family protein [Actinoplanes sp. ATCC 53533]
MILPMPRRALTAAVAALLGLPLAACSAGTPAADPAAPPSASASSPTEHLATPSAPAASLTPPPQGKGWTLSDIPVFPPKPPPQPITLPATGAVPYLSRIPTQQPVAFITIDDGNLKLPEAAKLMAAARVPVTLFLTTDAIKDDEPYFARLQQQGAVIEAHTITHTELRGKSYAFQRREICGSADRLGQLYQRRPVLFRPPFGTKDATTLRAARDCGIKAAFMWKETVHKGKVRYQEGKKVLPGDIILMHFRPAFVKDFLAALRAIHKAGLTPALLEDYIPA